MAQYLALNMARKMTAGLGLDVHVVLLEDGRLHSQFAECSTVHLLGDRDPAVLANELRQLGVRSVLANTAVSGRIVQALGDAGLTVVSMIHELPGVIQSYGLQPALADISVWPSASSSPRTQYAKVCSPSSTRQGRPR
jgi:hypothetical protein